MNREQELNDIFLSHFPGHVIQYFTDDKKAESRIARTSLQFDLEEANRMQDSGCGVFFSINGFKEGKRTKESLDSINAVYVDIDVTKEKNNLDEEKLIEKKAIIYEEIIKSPLEPHFVTETKNGFHLIWLVDDIQTEADFIFITKGLTQYFQADEGGLAVNKVLRLPGFLHLKSPSNPFLCELLRDNSKTIPKYKKVDIIDKFNLETEISSNTNESNTPSTEIQQALQLPIADVIKQSANMSRINIDFKNNSDGSQQIIENGEQTSGFISSRGDFVHSSSENGREGNQLTVAEYYLNNVGGNSYNRQEIAKILLGESSTATSTPSIKIEGIPICDYKNLLKMNLPKTGFIIDELIAENSLNLIVGDPGSFKTWIYLYYVYCIVENKLVFGKYEVNPTNVLIINIDDSLSLTKERMMRIGFSEDSLKKVYIWTKQDFKISGDGSKSTLDALSKFVKENNIGLIAIDTLRQIHDGDENNSTDMNNVMIALKDFAEEHNCAFVIVHHKRKNSGGFSSGGNVQAASGSIAIMANIFLSLHIKKDNNGNIQISREKSKSSKNIEPFYVSFQDDKKQESLFELVDKPNAKMSIEEVKEKIKELFDDNPEPQMTKKDFIEAFQEKLPKDVSISKKSSKDAFEELVEDEFIISDGINRPNNVKFYIKNREYEC